MDSILSVQNKNFSGDGKELKKVSRASEKPKSFTPTIHWTLPNHVKIYHGITELRHLIDLRRMVLLKERYEELKEGTSAVLLQSGLDEKMVG